MNKKHGLFLGVTVAFVGVALSTTIAYSLYKKLPTNVNIGIGAYTPSTDAFTYRIGSVTKTPGTITPQTDADGGYEKTDTITFDLGGQYPDTGAVAQKFYIGYLTVDVTLPKVGEDYATMALTPTLKYKEREGSNHKDKCFWGNSITAVAEPAAGHITFKGHIAFEAISGVNDVDVSLALKTTMASDADAVKFGSKAYSVSITFEEATKANGYDWLYIRGNGNGWAASNDYRLVPNLDAFDDEGNPKIEYMFAGLPGAIGEMKIANEDWSASAGTGTDKQGNLTPSHQGASDTYDVYWAGANSGLKQLSETENQGKYYINAN